MLATIALSAALSLPASAADSDTAAGIVAAQVRDQGYPCEEPAKATRDAAASKADATVWRLECRNATYLVHLRPNMEAKVERQK